MSGTLINLSTKYTRRSVNSFGVTVFRVSVTATYSGNTHSSQMITLWDVNAAHIRLLAALSYPSNLYQPLFTIPM